MVRIRRHGERPPGASDAERKSGRAPSQISDPNLHVTLEPIRRGGPLTRLELGSRSGLTDPTAPLLNSTLIAKRSLASRSYSPIVLLGGALSRELELAAGSQNASSSSGGGGGSPRPESFFSEDAERAAGCEMALDVESVLDGGVNGQEALG